MEIRGKRTRKLKEEEEEEEQKENEEVRDCVARLCRVMLESISKIPTSQFHFALWRTPVNEARMIFNEFTTSEQIVLEVSRASIFNWSDN